MIVGTKRQSKKKELTPVKTVIKTSIGGPFSRPYFILTAIALGFLALSPGMQALIPPPGGGYPGGNTAEGQNALLTLTTGTYNTAVGLSALKSDTAGSFNTATGADTLLLNTGNQNTATGVGALLSNSTGSSNTANGAFALLSNTTGSNNTANGGAALYSNTTGSANTANGVRALFSNTTAGSNTANGASALQNNTTGEANTAVGASTLENNTTGFQNTADGSSALHDNSTGVANTAIGAVALSSNTTGSFNNAIGDFALASNDSGFYNIAIGDNTLSNNVSGSHNIVIGGFGAGFNIVAGSNNIYIGPGVSANGSFDEGNTIRINDSAPARGGTSSQVFFAGIHGSTVGAVNAPVLINPNGQLGTGVSSARFKKDIGPMGTTSESIFSLKPVTFHYKGDETSIPQFGLIAEEVAKVNPALIMVDKEGKPYSVRYDQVNAMLLNEFLKEHKRIDQLNSKAAKRDATVTELNSMVAKQEAMIVRQQKAMEAFTIRLKEQDAKLQKESAQVQTNKPVPQMAVNP